MPEFDSVDAGILARRQAAFDVRQGPRVGDWVLMPDGTERRFTAAWDNGLQVTYLWQNGTLEAGSFYLGERGLLSYSGSLDNVVPFTALEDTGETRLAPVWFFHHDDQKAHNGVPCNLVVRVYRAKGWHGEQG